MELADLHIHSNKSDGLLSVGDIVGWGVKKRLRALSITDHDTVDGIDAAISCARDSGIEVVPGIELSTEYEDVEVHILGYFFDYHSSAMKSFLKKLTDSRVERIKKMVGKLNRIGINISFEDVRSIAGYASSMGRPHVARAIIKSGYSGSIEEAFDKYLSYGRPGYVERYKISPFQAVELISKCHGVSSVAHPGLIINIDKLSLIKKLREWGLSGIEVFHTKHTQEDCRSFLNMAESLGLIPTGGTDCHGKMVDGVPALGDVTVPYENVLKLKERI